MKTITTLKIKVIQTPIHIINIEYYYCSCYILDSSSLSKYKKTPTLYNELRSLTSIIINPRQLTNGDIRRIVLKSRVPETLKETIFEKYNLGDSDSEYDSDETIAEDG